MNTRFLSLTLMAIFGLTIFSCSKDEEAEPDPTPTESNDATPTPEFAGADAVLVAINTLTTTDTPIGPMTITLGTAVAVFFDADENFVDAGAVMLNSSELTKNDNNSYVYMPSPSEPTGINHASGSDWEVSGGSGIPAISYSPTNVFPVVGSITSSETVTRSAGYELAIDGVSGADSLIFNINGVIKTLPGNATSCTFSANELSNLQSGQGIVQAAGYNYINVDHTGKTVYYVKESVVSQTVTIE